MGYLEEAYGSATRSRRRINAAGRVWDAQEARADSYLTNTPASDLPLRWNGGIEILPASSVAWQSVIEPDAPLNRWLATVQNHVRREFPEVHQMTFWQPPGTFHLNMIILHRLTRQPLAADAVVQLLALSQRWKERVQPIPQFGIAVRGVSVFADGTILARVDPASDVPWKLRDEARELGLTDQQPILHITIGRIVTKLPPDDFRTLRDYLRTIPALAGTHVVSGAVLVEEREPYLNRADAFEVLDRLHFS